MAGTLHDDQCSCISRRILLRMRIASVKSNIDNQITHFLFNKFFFRKSFRQWDNVEKCGRAGQATDGNKIRLMLFACWTPKATNTHSEYVIVITFPLQQWLHERTSVLHCTYIACLVKLSFRLFLDVPEGLRHSHFRSQRVYISSLPHITPPIQLTSFISSL